MDSEAATKALLHYYCREGYYHSMLIEAQSVLKRQRDDPIFRFYYGIALVFDGQTQEAIRELDIVKDDPEVMLGAMLALIHAHRQCKKVDKEAIAKLDGKFKEERRKASEKGLYYAGLFLFLSKRYDKAKEYIDRGIKMSSAYKECYALKGWLEMMSSKDQDGKVKNVLEYFDNVLSSGKNIDALMGKAKFFAYRFNFTGALDLLNQVIVTSPNFLPGLIEKMKMQLALQDWEQAIDCANRAAFQNSNCIEAKRVKILHDLCISGAYDTAAKQLTYLMDSLRNAEPKNANLLYESAQLFSRTCGRFPAIMDKTLTMAEQAAVLDENNADYVTEVGYQFLLQSKAKEAIKHFKNATKIDETNLAALTGIIFCQLFEGHIDVAEQQTEFLREIHKSIGISPELLYLSSYLSLKKGDSVEALKCLNECVQATMKKFRGLPLGVEYYIAMNPDFLILITKEYLSISPAQPVSSGQSIPGSLKQSANILEPITKACPGYSEALFLLAKTKYLMGETRASGNMLQHILDQLDATHVNAHLLMAEILLHEKKPQQAFQSLERAVSYKFDIRDHPMYHLIKARVEKSQGKLEDSNKTLMTAMKLAGIKPSSGQVKRKVKHELQLSEQVSLYLELVETLRLMKQEHEAAKIMQDAINEFKGTSEEVRVMIANSDLTLSRNDVEQALTILRSITPEQSQYLQAREKMADIYLHHRKDKRLFASCYREIVDKTGSLESYLMLGDAYMSIQEPEMAIEVYEKAMKKNPRDTTLARKIGQALVKTHNYSKAISYYKEAIKNEDQSFLRYDLAELLVRLKQTDKAERVIVQALENEAKNPNAQDLASLMMEVKLTLLLAKVYQASGEKYQDVITSLTKARDVQSRVLKRVQVEQPNVLSEQKELAASICCQMAEYSLTQRDYEKATRLYKEALIYNENDAKALLDLAKLYLMLGDLESCHMTCATLLRNDENNEAATVMMADLMFRKNEYETAMFHFKQLLSAKPDYYEALGRLIEVLRRTGNLDDAQNFIDKVQSKSPKVINDPGFNFCKGLYEWYTGNTSAAIKSFNKARKSAEWGQKAIYNMIEICLNPDNDTIGGETFDEVDLENSQYDKKDFQDVGIRTADKLIRELKPLPGDVHHVILSNFLLLSTKQKVNAERALQEFTHLASMPIYREHVGILLGLATAYMILKQVPKARNQLKRISKSNWKFEEAEYLERCWILLADIYIQSGKYDVASELLKRVLEHNKSCCKAYEYMGHIMEKEQSYKDAAYNYELAWKFSNNSSPIIGYKLAFNYMKAKRYVDAIDVCHKVLAKFPNYPKIRKEILEKSRSNLRV